MLSCRPISEHYYEEFMKIHGTSYHLLIYAPNYPTLENSSIHTNWNLKFFINTHKEEISKLIKTCNDVNEFKSCVKTLILKTHNKILLPRPFQFYEVVLSEIKFVGSCCQLSDNFTCVRFEITDKCCRTHRAKIRIPDSYPNTAVIVEEHELPLSSSRIVNTKLTFNHIKSITDFYSAFSNLIEIFQPFWDAMEILDSSCWILEPKNPLLLDFYRCVKISDGCSILLTFNPYNSSEIPSIDVRGTTDDIDKVRCTLEGNLMKNVWEPDVDIYFNLLMLLNLESLPLKDKEDQGEQEALLKEGECAICFEERLDGETANQHCDNIRCNSQYHRACLLKYLCGNLNNVRMKNAVLGQCPACRDPIGCPLT